LIAILLEGSRKEYWTPTEEDKNLMVKTYAESIVNYSFNSGPYSGGNQYLDNMVVSQLKKMGETVLLTKYKSAIENGQPQKIEVPKKKD
jgi:cobalamin biosynthesis Mg chelatase CobN